MKSDNDYRSKRSIFPEMSQMDHELVNFDAEFVRVDTADTVLLINAIRSRDADMCKELLKAGVDVNLLNDEGVGPLHVAVEEGHIDIVELLLDNPKGHCDVNIPNALGQTPLMISVIFDDLELVKLLYKSGACLNDSDKTGKTPLLRALQESSQKTAKYLIKHGSDVNVVDHLGQSALFIAVNTLQEKCEKIVKALSKAGYDIEKDKPWLREAGLDVDHIQSGSFFTKLTRKFLKHIAMDIKTDKYKGSDQKEKNIKNLKLLKLIA